MRIALFDYHVVSTSPAGSCSLQLVSALADAHDVTVFSVRFDNPAPGRVRWVRIPAPLRPLALLFLWYAVASISAYLWYVVVRQRRFDLTIGIECYMPLARVVYAHFCHQHYLSLGDVANTRHTSVRSFMRWLDHRLRAAAEPFVYRRATHIVVPSLGLQRELESLYPSVIGRIHRIPNSVHSIDYTMPAHWPRADRRAHMGVGPNDVLAIFIALGHFERKGLPLVLTALASCPDAVKLVVVGGHPDLLAPYRHTAAALGISSRVHFVGMQSCVQPYFWISDILLLPTAYETFSLVVLEAAAAGVLPIVTPVNGVEEYIRDGFNGYLIERSATGLHHGVERYLANDAAKRTALQDNARASVAQYSRVHFHDAWRAFVDRQTTSTARGPRAPEYA